MKWVIYASNFLFFACIAHVAVLALSDPGYVKPESNDPDFFYNLLLTKEPSTLCPHCKICRTQRSRHCQSCDRCIDRFDHHCPWINNCVGSQNYHLFFSYVLVQFLFLLNLTYILIHYLFASLIHVEDKYSFKVIYSLFMVLILFFLFSLATLCYMQTINLFKNQTTFERYMTSKYSDQSRVHQRGSPYPS